LLLKSWVILLSNPATIQKGLARLASVEAARQAAAYERALAARAAQLENEWREKSITLEQLYGMRKTVYYGMRDRAIAARNDPASNGLSVKGRSPTQRFPEHSLNFPQAPSEYEKGDPTVREPYPGDWFTLTG
jgi:hypothetical protein